MKSKTLLLACAFAVAVFLLFPIMFIKVNIYYSFPMFSSWLFKIIGIVLLFFGCAFYLNCFVLFRLVGKGTPVPVSPPKNLVVKGIYKITRNPMYINIIVILIGYFFILGYLSLLFYLILVAVFFHLFIVFYEEPVLKKKFGEKYINYCKNTPRWL